MRHKGEGGEDAAQRSSDECAQEEAERLGEFATSVKPADLKFSLKHLTLLQSLPDNTWYDTHDTFNDEGHLGIGTEPELPDAA